MLHTVQAANPFTVGTLEHYNELSNKDKPDFDDDENNRSQNTTVPILDPLQYGYHDNKFTKYIEYQ